jgi:chaperonin GroES
MQFKPLGERALVQIVEREQTTASGIVLPDTAKEKPQTAEVVAVGQFENGVKVSEGDVIVFAKYSGTEISLDGEDYMILDARGAAPRRSRFGRREDSGRRGDRFGKCVRCVGETGGGRSWTSRPACGPSALTWATAA